MQKLIVSTFIFTAINGLTQEVRAESYIDFLNRTNSIRHTLKLGDTISEVLEDKGYRGIFKKGGSKDQTLLKNGISENEARRLPVGFELILPYDTKIAKFLKIKRKNKTNKAKRKIASLEKVKSVKRQELEKIFFLDLGYGARIFDIKQSGVLGSANVSVMTPNYFTFKTGFKINELTYFGDFGLSKFKMKSNSREASEDLMHSSFGLGYKRIFLGAGINQLPLFRNNAGSVEMVKISTTNVKIGYASEFNLKTQKETSISWEISGGIPLSGSSNNSDVKIKKVSGYNAQAKVSFEREISKNKKRQISYFIRQDFEYSDFNINTDWSTSKGSLDYTGSSSSFQAGFKFDF